jgi:ribosomal protein S12 methylthiotransferase accessory factor
MAKIATTFSAQRRRRPPAGVAASLNLLMQRFGVTRLARVTGLDRLGIEVVAAVRPSGHVLQVSQGKGRTLAQAQWSALGEAIELAAAERPQPERLVWRRDGSTAWSVGDEQVAWVRADDGRWVPAQEVYCPPSGQVWLGPLSTRWRSNGLGFHPTSRARARRHAWLEVVERDALARVLPHGWTAAAVRDRLLALPARLRAVRTLGFEAFAVDCSAGPTPVAGVLLFDLEGGAVPLTAGYAARPSLAAAVEAAFLEAAQSRLTEIHGAREDVLVGEREAGRALLEGLRALPPLPPRARRGPTPRVSMVTLREAPWVVKAVSPSALVTELL